MIARTLPTPTHGRYLVEPGSSIEPDAPLIIGCHGYAETAEQMLARLTAIPGAERWRVVSVQGLNRFYDRRADIVVAGWMTRQDRELAIADNAAYLNNVVDAVARGWGEPRALAFAGFSQGVAMAFRAATSTSRPVAAVIAAGGDIPPEITDESLRRCGRILLCHGQADDWYTRQKFEADVERLRRGGIEPTALDVAGGHEWGAAVGEAAGRVLGDLFP